MLTHLRIRNFKAWRDTGVLRLAPITVFFGTNSSGKSSLLQLLLLLKQTLDSPDRRAVLALGNGKGLVDVGSFRDLIHGHDLSRELGFEVGWTPLHPEDTGGLDRLSLKVRIGHVGRDAGGPRVLETLYSAGDPTAGRDPDTDQLLGVEVGLRRRPDEDTYQLVAPGLDLGQVPDRWEAPEKFHGLPDTLRLPAPDDWVGDLDAQLHLAFDRLFYVGPLRERPGRTYTWSGEGIDWVGSSGRETVIALLSAAERRLITTSAGEKRFDEVVAHWLERMGLIDSFRVQRIRQDRDDYEVLLQTKDDPTEVRLPDVGFGLSQVLPVLVQSFYAPVLSTSIFEQPEIHLHPQVQADLADLFVDAISARTENEPLRHQFLVESHSEHFLHRLQRRIAEHEDLTPDDVAIYFCRPGADGAQIEELEVDDYGNIVNWPENFFGDTMGDLAAMTRAAMRRQGAEVER